MSSIENLKVLQRKKFSPINMLRGDTLELSYTPVPDDDPRVTRILEDNFGAAREDNSYEILLYEAEESMTITEAAMFSGEFEGRKVIGAMLIS